MATQKPRSRLWKSARLGLAILAGMVIYAYGFDVTQVKLDEFRNLSRQGSRVRVARALARPDIFKFDQVEYVSNFPFLLPCPAGGEPLPPTVAGAATLVLQPACGAPGDDLEIRGSGFTPQTRGSIFFVPSADPGSSLALQLANVRSDRSGNLTAQIELPERPSATAQYIRVTLRRNVGWPRLTQTALDTWDKIVETVFLALLATTMGTLLSFPISFLAARNLMKDLRSSLTSIALSCLAWPAGLAIGYWGAGWLTRPGVSLQSNLFLSAAGVVAGVFLIGVLVRYSIPRAEEEVRLPPPWERAGRSIGMLVAAMLGLVVVDVIARMAIAGGTSLAGRLGSLGFLANFLAQAGDILRTLYPVFVAAAVGGVLGSSAVRLGNLVSERASPVVVRTVNLLVAATAGAVLLGLLGAAVDWLYQVDRRLYTLYLPAAGGAALGLVLALRVAPKRPLPVGLVVYYITRTILNAVRSIEALIMAIVAVIWVGIGPFAGVLALGVHTIASLSKLYSEQVESISPGPLEAVAATGATRLQTIVYAVIPQIIPPYISFTMYRWDINVRMSTIIGFAGGGGIGFLLQQNINLLQYRAASAQMLAIAIVVASMDYISSALRERVV